MSGEAREAIRAVPGLGTTLDQGSLFFGHALCITDDGRTAYATSSAQSNAVIDLDDLENPKLIQLFAPAAHDCGTSPDGKRLYLATFGFVSSQKSTSTRPPQTLTAAIAKRRAISSWLRLRVRPWIEVHAPHGNQPR